MRFAARTRRLERRFPPPRRLPESEAGKVLLTAGTVEWAVSLGCERHIEKRELGKITYGEWFHRLSVEELVVLGNAAHEQVLAEAREARRTVAPAQDGAR